MNEIIDRRDLGMTDQVVIDPTDPRDQHSVTADLSKGFARVVFGKDGSPQPADPVRDEFARYVSPVAIGHTYGDI